MKVAAPLKAFDLAERRPWSVRLWLKLVAVHPEPCLHPGTAAVLSNAHLGVGVDLDVRVAASAEPDLDCRQANPYRLVLWSSYRHDLHLLCLELGD
jgi:hypothetical protein